MKGLKTFKGGELPRDFWNYKVNPHTGFALSDDRVRERDINKKQLMGGVKKYYSTPFKTEA